MVVPLSAAHWVYLIGLAVLIATVVAKKNVIAPAIIATFLTGLVYRGSFTTGLSSVFNAAIAGTRELLPVFIIIALVTAMLGAMRALGADVLMIRPLSGFFRNGHISYVLLAVVTFLLSLAFWPTPVLPLYRCDPAARRAPGRPVTRWARLWRSPSLDRGWRSARTTSWGWPRRCPPKVPTSRPG